MVSLSLVMEIVLERKKMTEETGRGRERKREGKGVFFLGGEVSIRQALSLINLLLCGMRM